MPPPPFPMKGPSQPQPPREHAIPAKPTPNPNNRQTQPIFNKKTSSPIP